LRNIVKKNKKPIPKNWLFKRDMLLNVILLFLRSL
jgi:hypothetical protein